MKDLDIEVLNTEVKTAYSIIDQLQEKICVLDSKIVNKQDPPTTSTDGLLPKSPSENSTPGRGKLDGGKGLRCE